jgi:Tfp pilus assembly protein PilV
MVEVLFALAFLGFGLIAVSAMFPLSSRHTTDARSRTRAVSLAQAKAEELASMTPAELNAEKGTSKESLGHYVRSWTVTDSVPVPGSKQVDVTVFWDTPGGLESAGIQTFVQK